MNFTWDELIDRFRVYADDDHKDQNGWLKPAVRMSLIQVEYRQLYRKWLRAGHINVEPTDTQFTGSVVLSGVLAILGVAEVVGDGFRVLSPANRFNRDPFQFAIEAPAQTWSAFGSGEGLTVKLHPTDATGTYVVRYIPSPAKVTDSSLTVELPYMGDERLVLGTAKRAGIKENSASRLIENLIMEADGEMAMEASMRDNGNGSFVRDVSRLGSTPGAGFSCDPMQWMFV